MQTLLISRMINVTIIIPVYKVEQYIESCLYSVINQIYDGGIECIIVNDNTPDDSMDIVKRVLSGYNGSISFKVVNHLENKGLSAARNSGVKAATGDYLYFLDSDDILLENAIRLLTSIAQENLPDVVVGNFKLIGNCQTIPGLNVTFDSLSNQEAIFNTFISYGIYEMAWNKLVKTSFFHEHDLWFCEGVIHEDSLWSFLLFYNCKRLRICSQNTYAYRIREGSIMTDPQNLIKSFKSYCKIFHLKIDLIKQRELFSKFPFLVKYMMDAKFLLQKKVIEHKIGKLEYSQLQKEMGLRFLFWKKISTITRLKILLSNLPYGMFKLLMFHTFDSDSK